VFVRRRSGRSSNNAQRLARRHWLALCIWVCLLGCLGVGWSGSAVSAEQVVSPPSPAWLTRLADDAVQLAVARDPNWQVTRWSLSEPLAKVGQLTGGWSHDALLRWAQADEVTSYQTGWEAASAGLIPLEPLPLGAVFFTQSWGQRGAYVWQAGDGIRLHEESGVERMLFSWAADMEGLVAAASGEGEPVLAWQDPEGALWV